MNTPLFYLVISLDYKASQSLKSKEIESRAKQIVKSFERQDLGILLFLTIDPVENFFIKTTDKDKHIYRGIYVASTKDVMGLGSFKKVVTRKAFGEEDIEFIEVGKFLKDCLEGDMESLNILTAENVIYNTDEKFYNFYSNIRSDPSLFFSRNLNNKVEDGMVRYLSHSPETVYVFTIHEEMLTYVLQAIHLNTRFDVSGISAMNANNLKNIIDLNRSLDFHLPKMDLSKAMEVKLEEPIKYPKAMSDVVEQFIEMFEDSKTNSTLPVFPTNRNTIEKDLIHFRIKLFKEDF